MEGSQASRPTDPASDGVGAFTAATGRELGRADQHQRNYRRYQYDLIAPHCGASVLEVGAGLGDFSAQFTGRTRIIVTDVDPGAVASMADRFVGRAEMAARQLDVTAMTPAQAQQYADRHRPVDSVLAINVLEHIEDDVATLQSMSRLVHPGGTVVIWVPGYMSLYGDFDRSVGHVRRYTPATLDAAARQAGLGVRLCRPVNLLGGLAWWAAVRKGGTGSPKPSLVRIYDAVVVPASRVLDHLRVPFGQSILGVFTRDG